MGNVLKKLAKRMRDREIAEWSYVTASGAQELMFAGRIISLDMSVNAALRDYGPDQARHWTIDPEDAVANKKLLQHLTLHAIADSKSRILQRLWNTMHTMRGWVRAQQENDYGLVVSDFAKLLRAHSDHAKDVIRLAGDDHDFETPYDVILDRYSIGLRSKHIERWAKDLVPFCKARSSNGHAQPRPPKHVWYMDVEDQKQLQRILLKALGVDLDRLDIRQSPHPICRGARDDVKMGFRYDETDFLQLVLDTVHEGGHALYRQNLPKHVQDQPIGDYAGAAIDESSAILMESYVCRSREFAQYLYDVLARNKWTPEDLTVDDIYHRLTRVNRMRPLRTDADEIHYPLHVLARYHVESAAVNGTARPEDLADLWKQKSKAIIGLRVLNDRLGVLQDMHPYAGKTGYFMAYLMGTLTAAQLWDALRKEKGDVLSNVQKGDFSDIKGWMTDKIYKHGARLEPFDLIKQATGKVLSIKAYKAHIDARYGVAQDKKKHPAPQPKQP